MAAATTSTLGINFQSTSPSLRTTLHCLLATSSVPLAIVILAQGRCRWTLFGPSCSSLRREVVCCMMMEEYKISIKHSCQRIMGLRSTPSLPPSLPSSHYLTLVLSLSAHSAHTVAKGIEIDVRSCILSLIDLYSHWLSHPIHTILLHRVLRSIFMLSDLFALVYSLTKWSIIGLVPRT